MPSNDLLEKISDDLEAKYHAKGWQKQWASEKQIILELADEILVKPADRRFIYERALGVGATGVVLGVWDKVMIAKRAMKLPRPHGEREEEIREGFEGEIQKLLALNHQNIVKIYHRGSARIRLVDYPYFLMEFIEGGDDLVDSLRKGIVESPRGLLDLVRQVATGLDFLHGRGIVHFDIKPGNILVSPEGQAMITDLGFAKDLSKVEPGSEVVVRFTRTYAHPDLIKHEMADSKQASSDSHAARAVIKVKNEEDVARCRAYDRFSLGETIFEMLALQTNKTVAKLTRYERSYLRLIAARLLGGHNREDRLWERLPRSVLKELSYQSSAELRVDSEKLTSEYSLETDIPELNPYIADVIQIPAVFKVPFTERVRRIIVHKAFRRLAQVGQLGLLTHVYPSASHSRFEHSLGTFATTCEYVRALYHDEGSPLFRSIMRKEDIETLLVASLLHDLGQYPLAHDLEDLSSHVFGHDRLTVDILNGTVTPVESTSPIWNAIVPEDAADATRWTVGREALQRLVDPAARGSLTFREKILRAIINGPIDADKSDYIYRDSTHLGIPFGTSVDFPRLMKCLTVAVGPDGASPLLGILDKGRVVGDAVGFARYSLFSAAYWHHTARAMKAMIHYIAGLALANSRDLETLRSDFAKFVFESTEMVQAQFTVQVAQFIFNSQVRREDLDVLRWLAQRSGAQSAMNLVEDLAQRQLYKRLLDFGGEDTVREQVLRIKWAGFDALEECRVAFEEATIKALPTALRTSLPDKVHARPLFLIDAPWRPGGEFPPGLIVRRRPDEELLEGSDLLRLLYDNDFFSRQVSRLRVFVNPSIRDDILPHRKTVEDVFRSVVGKEHSRRQ